jgi:hypothetical protein
LGAYSKAEDEAMNSTFGARGKRSLNIVFDVIGFIYPDYCFPTHKQGTERKIATTTSSAASKPKRAKVLTHRPKLHSLEKNVAVPAIEKTEVVEYAKATPLSFGDNTCCECRSYCRSGRRNNTKELKDRAITEVAESPKHDGVVEVSSCSSSNS